MKKSSLIFIIIGLISLISAIIGALYVLKKRGILFADDEFEYDFDDFDDDEFELLEIDEVSEEPAKRKRSSKKDNENHEEQASD